MFLTQSNNNIAQLRQQADIIDEASALITYLGFCQPGTTGTDKPKFSIMKITQSAATPPAITTFFWAEGRASFDLVWNDRATYTYKFRTF